MKRLLELLFTIMIYILSLSHTQAQYSDSDLLGTWHPSFSAFYEGLSADEQANYDSFPSIQQEAIQNGIEAKLYTFEPNGHFTIELVTENEFITGTWTLAEDGLTLTLAFTDGKETIQQIESLDTENLTLAPIEGEEGEHLYLIK